MRVRALVALILMVVAFSGAAAWKPRTFLADQTAKVNLDVMFPRSFGDWVVDERMPVQLISPDQAAVLNAIYSQTLSRTYVNRKGERIMLSVAYGGDQSDATRAHRPEVCYPAQGFQILSQRAVTIDVGSRQIPARNLVTKLGARVEPVTYWVVVGETIATSGTDQKLAQLRYTTRGIIPDGMLVRISNIDPEAESSFELHRSFLEEMKAAFDREQVSRVFGG